MGAKNTRNIFVEKGTYFQKIVKLDMTFQKSGQPDGQQIVLYTWVNPVTNRQPIH